MRASQLRTMVAAFFAVAAIAAAASLRHAAPGIILIAILLFVAATIVAIAILLDYPPLARQPRPSELAEELESQQLLSGMRYCADRAFRVQASQQHGPHYFVELENGDVLHLSGPYLHNYEPAEGRVRHFPCTQFTIRRHTHTGQAVDILCEGLVIEPEVDAPPYSPCDCAEGLVPADGEILSDSGYDELRQRRAGILGARQRK